MSTSVHPRGVSPIMKRVIVPATGEVLVRPGLTLTVYLDVPNPRVDPVTLVDVCRSYLERIDPGRLRWFWSSVTGRWRTTGNALHDILVGLEVQAGGVPRHLFRFSIVDSTDVPSWGFTWFEADPARSTLTSYLQLYWPWDADPDELLAMAIEIGQTCRVHAGVGGLHFNWNRRWMKDAMDAIARLARRYLGIDVQVPDLAAEYARRALPGTSWVTLVGTSLPTPPPSVTAPDIAGLTLASAYLFRAGERPQAGDVNFAEYPHAQASVARALSPLIVRDPPPFLHRWSTGGSDTADDTVRWLRRFERAEDWT